VRQLDGTSERHFAGVKMDCPSQSIFSVESRICQEVGTHHNLLLVANKLDPAHAQLALRLAAHTRQSKRVQVPQLIAREAMGT